MNVIDILIIVVLGFSLLAGMYKGFLASLLSLIGFIASWFGAKYIYLTVAKMALGNSTLMSVLSQYLEAENMFASLSEASIPVAGISSDALNSIVNGLSKPAQVVADAFKMNVQNQAFANLNLTTLSEYLDQTIFQAIFYVLAFIVSFIVIYFAVSLIVNLFNRVIRFPVLRGFDALVGGVFGLVRGLVVCIMILALMPTVVSVVAPELAQTLQSESVIYGFVMQLDFMKVRDTFNQLMGLVA